MSHSVASAFMQDGDNMPWWLWSIIGYIIGTMVDLLLLGFVDLVKHSDRRLDKDDRRE
jgi:hypothetical protein